MTHERIETFELPGTVANQHCGGAVLGLGRPVYVLSYYRGTDADGRQKSVLAATWAPVPVERQ
jgi:hypothetical protein